MKPISFVVSGLLLAILASLSHAQSLGDLAKKEQERRQAVKAQTKVITNDQAAKAQTGPVTTTIHLPGAPPDKTGGVKTPGEGERTGAAGAAVKEKPLSTEPVDFEGRPESFWRQTFADARKRVSDLENQATAMVLKLNDLQNRFYRESDGYKQQEIQREIQKTFYEQDLTKQNLAQAKEMLTDLEKEARKSGALPGWIR